MATYLVTGPDGAERIVEAANQAQARNHAARNAFTVAVAKSTDIARVVKAGGDIEQAGEAAAEAEVQAEEQPITDTQPNDDPPEERRKQRARDQAGVD